jgi:hypothetical protein
VHIDIAELRLAQGKLNMFLAIDRVSKFTYVEFRDDLGKMNGADFLRGVINAFPYKIHTVLTDNGRGGSGNSDSWISGGLASQSRSQDRIQEQEHDEENKTEPLRQLQSQSGSSSTAWR